MSLISDSSFTPKLSVANPGDYFGLVKPRVMSLVIFTALAGILLAPVQLNPIVAFAALLAIAVGAGASGALNMWYDADIDALMRRTSKRPVPSGRVQPHEAAAFGATLAVLAVLTLWVVTNIVAASLLAFTIFFYAVIYTMWLKRTTPQNIVIGGAAGPFRQSSATRRRPGRSARRASFSSPSSSSGRRRISGPWPSSRRRNTAAPACR